MMNASGRPVAIYTAGGVRLPDLPPDSVMTVEYRMRRENPPIDVLDVATALMDSARAKLDAATKRHDGSRIGAHAAWRAAQRDWCHAVDLAAELQRGA